MSQKTVVRLYISLIGCVFSAFLGGHGFGAGTLIETPNGMVPIEQIRENDLIISRNKMDNTFVPKPVTACSKRITHRSIKLTTNKSSITVSPKQRFYLAKEQQWAFAKDLKPGQLLLQNGGTCATIADIEKIENDTEMYELSVQDLHNFCAADDKVVAHNHPGLMFAATEAAESGLLTTIETAADYTFIAVAAAGVAKVAIGKEALDGFWKSACSTAKSAWNRVSSCWPWGSDTPDDPPPATGGAPISPSQLVVNTVLSPGTTLLNALPDAAADIANKTRPGGTYPDKDKQDNTKKALACAGGAPLPSDDDPNKNSNDKSGPKIKPKTEPTREETHSIIFDTYEQARNEALKIIGLVDQKTAIPIRSDVKGICFNKIAGTRWHGHKVSMRLDHSPEDGPHINVTDFRPEKGPGGVNIKIKFKGDASVVESLLRPLNTSANISMAKNLGVEISKIVEGATNTNFAPKTTNISKNSIGLGAATTLVTSVSQNIDANKGGSQNNTAGNIINSAGGIANTGGQIATPGFVGSTLPVTLSSPHNSGINIFPILPSASGLPCLPGTFGIPNMPSINFTPSNISPITSITPPQLNGLTNFGLNTGSATTTNSLLQNLFNGPPRGALGF